MRPQPPPRFAPALFASLALHASVLAFVAERGAPAGQPDGSRSLVVELVTEERPSTPEADRPVEKPTPAPARVVERLDPNARDREDRHPRPAETEIAPAPGPSTAQRIVDSTASTLVVAGGEEDPSPARSAAKARQHRRKEPKRKATAQGRKASRIATRQGRAVPGEADAPRVEEARPTPGATGERARRLASAGSGASEERFLPPSLRDALIELLQRQIERCYAPPPGGTRGIVLPVLGIHLLPNGTLSAEPRIVRSGRSPNDAAIARAALTAVRRCAPYGIPARFGPYYDAWKDISAEFEFPVI